MAPFVAWPQVLALVQYLTTLLSALLVFSTEILRLVASRHSSGARGNLTPGFEMRHELGRRWSLRLCRNYPDSNRANLDVCRRGAILNRRF